MKNDIEVLLCKNRIKDFILEQALNYGKPLVFLKCLDLYGSRMLLCDWDESFELIQELPKEFECLLDEYKYSVSCHFMTKDNKYDMYRLIFEKLVTEVLTELGEA